MYVVVYWRNWQIYNELSEVLEVIYSSTRETVFFMWHAGHLACKSATQMMEELFTWKYKIKLVDMFPG